LKGDLNVFKQALAIDRVLTAGAEQNSSNDLNYILLP
jgi:hypothetical protein